MGAESDPPSLDEVERRGGWSSIAPIWNARRRAKPELRRTRVRSPKSESLRPRPPGGLRGGRRLETLDSGLRTPPPAIRSHPCGRRQSVLFRGLAETFQGPL